MSEDQDLINDYAERSLRYTADEDYISARMSYRVGLVEPFLWSSLHAIEKYLKALLLFNKKKAKGFQHNIVALLIAAKEIEGLNLRLPTQTELFVKYINKYGENRYFEGSVYLDEYALDSLDETVWYIRRHCYDRSIYEDNLRQVEPSDLEQNPKEYRLPRGFLEKIINEKPGAYRYLVWDNFFYGKQQIDRNNIRKRQSKFSVINPSLVFLGGQQTFDALKDYVDFSGDTKRYFKRTGQE